MTRSSSCALPLRILCSLCLPWSLACARPPLPSPQLPLVVTPDAPFRWKPPLPSAGSELATHEGPALEVQTAQLHNGMPVWLTTKRSLPYVALSVVARDGGTLDSSELPELLRLTMRSVILGGLTWTDGNVVDPPKIHGESVSYAVLPTHSSFDLRVLSEALAPAIDVLARTVRYPAFVGDFDLARLLEANDIQERSGGLDNLMLKLTTAAAYGDDLSNRLLGTELEPLKSLTLDAVRACALRVLRPESSALVVSGDVEMDVLLPLLERAFGDWSVATNGKPRPSTSDLTRAYALRSDGRRVHLLLTGDAPQSHVLILQPAPTALADDDVLAFAVLAELAVGSFRSRANISLRHDSGLTYGVHPRFMRGRAAGLVLVEAAFEVDETRSAIESLLEMFRTLRSVPVSRQELSRAKDAVAAALDPATYDNETLAATLGRGLASGKPASWLSSRTTRLAAVSVEDVQRVAVQYLHPDDVEIGIAADTSVLNQAAALGQVTTYSTYLK